MRYFLIFAVLFGIIAPVATIYTHQQEARALPMVTPPTIEATTEPTPETTPPPILTPTVEATTEPTVEPTIEPIIEPTPTAEPTDLNRPQLLDKAQVKTFMLLDQTDKIPPSSTWVCEQYAMQVVQNANELGIEAHPVAVKFEDAQYDHAIVRFPTVKDGDVFVDASVGDWWVDLGMEQGQYFSYSMTDPNVHFHYGRTVLSYCDCWWCSLDRYSQH